MVNIRAYTEAMTSKLQARLDARGELAFTTFSQDGQLSVRVTADGSVTIRTLVHGDGDDYVDGPVVHACLADEVWVGQGQLGQAPRRLKLPHFCPTDPAMHWVGSSVLVVAGRDAVLAARNEVTPFKLAPYEHVTQYVGVVGNSCSPYGFVRTNKRVIFPRVINCGRATFSKTASAVKAAGWTEEEMTCMCEDGPFG